MKPQSLPHTCVTSCGILQLLFKNSNIAGSCGVLWIEKLIAKLYTRNNGSMRMWPRPKNVWIHDHDQVKGFEKSASNSLVLLQEDDQYMNKTVQQMPWQAFKVIPFTVYAKGSKQRHQDANLMLQLQLV